MSTGTALLIVGLTFAAIWLIMGSLSLLLAYLALRREDELNSKKGPFK